MAVPSALLELSRHDPHAAIERVVMYSFSSLAAKPSFPGPGAWLRGGARGLMRQVLARQGHAGLFFDDFSACHQYAGGLEAAAKATCPSTLILAAQDQMTPTRATGELAATLKATVHTVPGGHFLMQECPEHVLNAMRQCLA